MKKSFNKLNEHLLIPLLLVSAMPLLIGMFYLFYEYITVYTNSEAAKFYLFNTSESKEKYLDSTMFGILVCLVLLALSTLSVKWKKSWLLLLLCLANFSQLVYLLLA